MNKLDVILLLPIAIGFVFGLFKGLIRELTSLAAIVLGIMGARLLAPVVSGILVGAFDFSERTAKPTAYLLLFIAIAIGLLFAAKALDKIFNSLSLGGVNKFLGGIFGGLKIALIVSVLLNVFDALDSKFSILNTETKESSIGYKPLMKMGPGLWDEAKKNKQPNKESDEEKESYVNK